MSKHALLGAMVAVGLLPLGLLPPELLPLGLLPLGLLAGCTAPATQVSASNPYPAVPPPIAETEPKPPVTAESLLWQPGHWNWTGSGYQWARGQYVPAAGHGSLWMPGWWTRSAAGWQWQPPHWTS